MSRLAGVKLPVTSEALRMRVRMTDDPRLVANTALLTLFFKLIIFEAAGSSLSKLKWQQMKLGKYLHDHACVYLSESIYLANSVQNSRSWGSFLVTCWMLERMVLRMLLMMSGVLRRYDRLRSTRFLPLATVRQLVTSTLDTRPDCSICRWVSSSREI